MQTNNTLSPVLANLPLHHVAQVAELAAEHGMTFDQVLMHVVAAGLNEFSDAEECGGNLPDDFANALFLKDSGDCTVEDQFMFVPCAREKTSSCGDCQHRSDEVPA